MSAVGQKGLPRFAVFASGRGSNFEALLRAGLRDRVAVLVCDRREAGAIEIARQNDVPVLISRDEGEIRTRLENENIAWIVLAGYMRILSAEFIDSFRSPSGVSRILNIHPSLLPAFPGMRGYEKAFHYGCKQTGITVHLVEPEMDSGPVLAQETFAIDDCRDAEEVEARGLKIEHRLYADTIAWALREEFTLEKSEGRLRVRKI